LVIIGSVYLLPVQFKGSCHTCDLTLEITQFFCPSKFVWFMILYHTNLLVTPNHIDSSIQMNLCDSGPSITQISQEQYKSSKQIKMDRWICVIQDLRSHKFPKNK
jgi:hypothetical protein